MPRQLLQFLFKPHRWPQNRHGTPTMTRLIAVWLVATLCTSCSWLQDQPYELMWSADKGSDLFILEARFDNRGDAAPGAIAGGSAGKLGDGGKTMVLDNRKFPKRGTFVWRDHKTDKVYRGELVYPDNLAQIADDLEPTYTIQTSDEPRKGRRILMTGFSNDHQVIGWLTNTGSGPGVTHRDIREVARAQGVEVRASPRVTSSN